VNKIILKKIKISATKHIAIWILSFFWAEELHHIPPPIRQNLQIDKQLSSKETNPKTKKNKTRLQNRRMRVRESDDTKKPFKTYNASSCPWDCLAASIVQGLDSTAHNSPAAAAAATPLSHSSSGVLLFQKLCKNLWNTTDELLPLLALDLDWSRAPRVW
jgi:hypothetical protein